MRCFQLKVFLQVSGTTWLPYFPGKLLSRKKESRTHKVLDLMDFDSYSGGKGKKMGKWGEMWEIRVYFVQRKLSSKSG